MSPARLAVDSLGAAALRVADLARDRVGRVPTDLAGLARDPVGVAHRSIDMARSVGHMVQPVTQTLSPLMTDRRLTWRYDTLDVPFEALRAAGRAAGGTLNDAFMAAVSGGLARYHERHGRPVDELRVTMPVSLRRPGEPEGGNRITLARMVVPVGLQDPGARIRAVGTVSREWRREPAIPYSNVIAGVLNLLPRSITGGMLKHVDFLASDVPGFGEPVYIAGARMESFYPFGPTIGSSANVTLMSYAGTCNIGITADTGAVTEPDELVGCIAEGFEEVLSLAGGPAEGVRRPG
jgi:hypothetical protein